MTRNGAAVSDDYIAVHKDSGINCSEPMRQMVTHDADFKQYLKSQRQRMQNVVNQACKFEDGPTGITYFKKQILNYKYESLEKIKVGSKRIHASQDTAIVKAF